MGKNSKKIVAITTALTMIAAITGCSKGNEKSSMGRYVEERYEAPTNSYVNELSILEDGRIAMLGFSNETNTPISFISDDGGQNWTTQDLELPKQDGKETYTNNIGYLSDGRILVLVPAYKNDVVLIPLLQVGIITIVAPARGLLPYFSFTFFASSI